MVLFNYSTKELTAKIVYYGPGLCGKTTNLEFIYESLPEDKRGRMLSLSTQTDRTLYFDFLPVELGDIRGMKTRVQLYTVPGQVFYDETRRLVLKGVDGIVFVADSQSRVSDANIESFRNLEKNLEVHGLSLSDIPMVLQFNKRDLPDIKSVEEMNAELNRYNAPFYEVIATTGIGVHDTLKAISKLVLRSLTERYDGAERPLSSPPPVAAHGHGDMVREMTPAPEADMPTAMDDGIAGAPSAKASHGDDEWEAADLESELDQMDADEIQGLLEEVDCFEAEDTDSFSEPDPARETSSTTAAIDDPASPDDPADETDLFRTPAAEEAFAGAPIPENQDEPTSAPFTQEGQPEPPESSSQTGPEAEGEHAIWLGAPEEEENHDPPGDLYASDNGGGEAALSFENYLEQNQSLSHEESHGDGDPFPSSPPEHQVSPAGSQQDLITTLPETGDRPPTLLPGKPVQDADGHLRMPIQLEMGGQQYTYILTLTLQPQADDPA
jgi:hypothetical protein